MEEEEHWMDQGEDEEMEEEEEEEEEEDTPRLLPEMWLHILSFLPPRDLGSVAMVSRDLSDLAKLPRLWRRADIRMIRFRTHSLQQFLYIRRFRQVSRLNFSRIKLSESDIRLVLDWSLTSSLIDLDMTGLNLSPISPDLVSRSLYRLKKASLGFTKLTTEQTVHLFTYCHNHPSSKQEELCIKAVNLSQVPPEYLSTTITYLRTADLSFTELTVEQVTCMFQRMVSSKAEVRLSNLDLFSVDLSLVCPILLARAVTCLTDISLSNTELRLEHSHAIFDHLLQSKSVRNLNLDFAELFSVPVEWVGRTVSRLDTASLACAVLGEEQVLSLAVSLAEPSSSLTQLDLLDMQLTFLPPEVLVSSLGRLSKVNLSGSKLSPQQVDCLISGINISVMKNLNLDYVDVSSCGSENLSNLVCGLEVVSLKKSRVSEEQLEVILTQLGSNQNTLTTLCLHGNNLATVNPLLLSGAAPCLISLDLSNCLLSTTTCSTLLSSLSLASSSLRCLTLLGNRLGEVATSVFPSALTHLHKLDLSSTCLTVAQMECVLTLASPPLRELSLFSLDLGTVRESILREAETRVFVSHRHAAITPDS